MTLLPDGYFAPDILEAPKRRQSRARGLGFAGILIGLVIIAVALILMNTVGDDSPSAVPPLMLIAGLVLSLSSSALLAWARPALTREPTDDPRIARLLSWAAERYGLTLSKRDARVLLGELGDITMIDVNGHGTMIGTPIALRPSERLGLIHVEDGDELPRADTAGRG